MKRLGKVNLIYLKLSNTKVDFWHDILVIMTTMKIKIILIFITINHDHDKNLWILIIITTLRTVKESIVTWECVSPVCI